MDDYTYTNHLWLTIIGLVFLVVLVFTLRSELSYLLEFRKQRLQFILSLLSIFLTIVLSLTCLLHWMISPFTVFATLLILGPLVLVIALLILLLRTRTVAALARSRMEEQKKLIVEVQEIIDEKKRERIREGKRARGEKLDD
jgi:amino acid transporter